MNKFTALTLLFSSFFHINVLLANGPEDIVQRADYLNQLSKLLNGECKGTFALDEGELRDFEGKKEQYVEQGDPYIFSKEFISFLDSMSGTFKVRGEIFYSPRFSSDKASSTKNFKIQRWRSHFASLLGMHSEVTSLMKKLGFEGRVLRRYERELMVALGLDTLDEIDQIKDRGKEPRKLFLPEERFVIGQSILATLKGLNIVKCDQDIQRSLRRAFRNYMQVINGEGVQEFDRILDVILKTLKDGIIASCSLYSDFPKDEDLRRLINSYSDLLDLLSLFKCFNIKPENFAFECLRELDEKTGRELSSCLTAVINEERSTK